MRILIVIILLFYSLELLSQETINDSINHSCNINKYDEYLIGNSSIKYALNFDNRKFIKEVIKKISFNKSRFSLNNFNSYQDKWMKAKFIIIGDKTTCKYKAKFRLTGDLQDHFESGLSKGNITGVKHSLLVKLINGNIDGVTRFKLFLPPARHGDNEIFGALLFKKLKFLSPRTFNINIAVNSIQQNYTFQEDLNKEFLEFNHRSEGLILEGDERFGINKRINFARIINSDWSIQNFESTIISINALKEMNKAYMATNERTNINSDNPFIYNPAVAAEKLLYHPLDKTALNKISEFYALTYVLTGGGGLSKDDSRFYFNHIYGHFEPIYYDSMIRIVNTNSNINCGNNKYCIKKIPSFLKKGLDSLLQKIDFIDHNIFFDDIISLGASYEKKEIVEMFSIIKSNIIKLSQLPSANSDDLYTKNNVNLSSYFSDKKFDSFIEIEDLNSLIFKKCGINFDKCINYNLDKKTLALALKQRLENENGAVVNISGYSDEKKYNYPYSIFNWKSINLNNSTYLKYPEGMKVSINKNKKLIQLNAVDNSNNQVIIHGDKLIDWTIKYNGITPVYNQIQHSRFSKNGLTGCLNFHDIKIKDINIFVKYANCEDGLHFLRSFGSLKNINISDTYSDALDIDFSNILIKSINIHKSGNDCIDLSAGIYEINNVITNLCGDKGISVGERAKLLIDDLEIKSSSIGVASKDSSIVKINTGLINAKDFCGASYKKKQEFGGAFLDLNNVVCSKSKFFVGNESELFHSSIK